MKPEHEFFASKTTHLINFALILYVAINGVPVLFSDVLRQQVGAWLGLALIFWLGWFSYAMFRYPSATIYSDHVTRCFAWPKNASIPYSEITGIHWQVERNISFATNGPKSRDLYLRHLSKADRDRIRSILSEKLQLPELAI